MRSIVVFLALMVVASSASALKWRQCAPFSAKIKSLEVPECNTSLLHIHCALPANKNIPINVDYLQGEKLIKDPAYLVEFQRGFSVQPSGRCLFGLDCPGKQGQEQHRFLRTLKANAKREAFITMRLKIGERASGIAAQAEHLFVQIPSQILFDKSSESTTR